MRNPEFEETTATTRAAAAAMVAPHKISMRTRVYDYVLSCGDNGATEHEISEALGMWTSTVTARRNDLTKCGEICSSGRTRLSPRGCKMIVWVAVPKTLELTNEPTA